MKGIKAKPAGKTKLQKGAARLPGLMMKRAWLAAKGKARAVGRPAQGSQREPPGTASQQAAGRAEGIAQRGVGAAFWGGRKLAKRMAQAVFKKRRSAISADAGKAAQQQPGHGTAELPPTLRAAYGRLSDALPPPKKGGMPAPPSARAMPPLNGAGTLPHGIKCKPAGSIKTAGWAAKAIGEGASRAQRQKGKPGDRQPPNPKRLRQLRQAEASARSAKAAARVTARLAKALAAAIKETVSMLTAGGWIAVMAIVLVCGIALVGAFLGGQGQDASWQGTGPFVWPLPQGFTITSPFGERIDPISGGASFHTGTDIAAPEGTPILAAADGVAAVVNSAAPQHSYGYYVKLQHGDGFETLYAHCSAVCIEAGQEVAQGEVVGFVGSTGDSTGDHLHFEVWIEGARVDAMGYFAAA